MSEEDYQILKIQQGLFVDFGAFGQKFIDLLNLCEKDERLDNPKFQLQIYTKDPLTIALQGLRESYNKLSKEYDECKMSLLQRLESTQQVLSQKSNKLDRLKIKIETQLLHTAPGMLTIQTIWYIVNINNRRHSNNNDNSTIIIK